MLRTLRIRNLLIIEDLTVEFGPGLNVLTGETGAGKSILIDALGLVAGDRADRALVRAGADVATVEALFDVAGDDALLAAAREVGIDPDEGQFLVRRELRADGGHRILVNGSPCTAGPLRELGARLVAIHGQDAQRDLRSAERQRGWLDRYAVPAALLDGVREAYRAVRAAQEAAEELERAAAERAARVERLQVAVREIEAVDPRPGELDELDRRRALLRHAERFGELLREAVAFCYEGDETAAALASAAARRVDRLAEIDPALADAAERLRSASVEIQEIGATLAGRLDELDAEPGELERLESRRAALEKLLLRHGSTEEEILAARDAMRAELARLGDLDRARAEARERIDAAVADYATQAALLTERRREGARRLAREAEKQFRALALERARLRIALPAPAGETVRDAGGRALPLSPHGAERVEFELAANPGQPFAPLARAASGGELSRVTLALHVAARAGGEEPVQVFDEVDAGLGGDVADAVGARLAELGTRAQVLCVTHLPQVAAHAAGHVHVRKKATRSRTTVELDRLEGEGRVEELARMLGGRAGSRASRQHAGELLAAARREP